MTAFARQLEVRESIKIQRNQTGQDGASPHPVLIHFSLEQIERVLSTGCMVWTNAESR
jgi:hypothetical protein